MTHYRTLVFNQETGEVIFVKEYSELFPLTGLEKASREIKLLYYVSRRFDITRQNLGVYSEAMDLNRA